MAILTLSFHLVGVSAPHYLPHVLLYLECSPLRPLGFLLVEDCHHRPHLQAVEDAGTGLCPVQHPGGCDRTSSPCSSSSGLLCPAIEAAAEPGCTHLHCIAMRKTCRNLFWFLGEDARPSVAHRTRRLSNMSKPLVQRRNLVPLTTGRGFKCQFHMKTQAERLES